MNEGGLLTLDFIRTYPHKMWISDWSSDEQYPEGFRYKILSARIVPDNVFELLIVIQQRNGEKEILKNLEVDESAFDRVSSVFVNGLRDEYSLDFEAQNFTTCRRMADFDAKSVQYGWLSREVLE
jgi:hypothetical protein